MREREQKNKRPWLYYLSNVVIVISSLSIFAFWETFSLKIISKIAAHSSMELHLKKHNGDRI